MASPAGRTLPPNPFRNLAPPVSAGAPAAGHANPFRPVGATVPSRSGGNPFSRPHAAAPVRPMERMASIAPTVQIASADPEIHLAYVLPPAPSPSGRSPNTGADPYNPPYLQESVVSSGTFVPYVPCSAQLVVGR